MNLIINAGLSEPPSESLYFRYFTLVAADRLDYSVLIESEKEMVDFYYKYLKAGGLMDYVEEIVTPEERVEGLRVDIKSNFSRTILIKKITCDNVFFLLGKIKRRKLNPLGDNPL